MKYIVTGKIKRDKETLKVGSIVEFDAEEGDRLVADGYLSGPSASDRAVAKKAMGDADEKGTTKPAAVAKPAATAKKAGK